MGAWHRGGRVRPAPARRRAARCEGRRHGRRGAGQALVEFALILPLFLFLFFGIIEFGFYFNAQLSLNYATRDASLAAAEAGNNANADCLILQQINADLSPPTDESAVLIVHIFSADQTGHPVSGVENTYTRGGTTTCGSITVPYTAGASGYPYNVRCSDLDRTSCAAGFTSAGNPGVDIVGVRIDYTYRFKTPLGSLSTFLGSHVNEFPATTTTLTASNSMRMEPVL